MQEIGYNDVFKGSSVYCEMIVTPEQARRKTVVAGQAALTKRGVAVLVVPADVVNAPHTRNPVRENGRDLIEVRVTRANERMPRMNSKRWRCPKEMIECRWH